MTDEKKTDEQRQFFRVPCQLQIMFQLPSMPACWFSAEVLDLSIVGVRLCFKSRQQGISLKVEDIQWQDALFRFQPSAGQEFILSGHFLMIYDQEAGNFTTGVEFTEMAPEDQFKLVVLYAEYQKQKARKDH